MSFERDVAGAPEEVFDVIADLRSYGDWLPESGNFKGTEVTSAGPVAAGSTYVEREPLGRRDGTVTTFARPGRIAFHQPMTMKGPLGSIDITLTYRLSPAAGGTHVHRTVDLAFQGPVKVAQPLIKKQFAQENERTLDALRDRFAG